MAKQPKPRRDTVPLSELHRTYQVRETLDQATVDRYAESLREGADMAPVLVGIIDGEKYLLDGYHRAAAADAAGYIALIAEIHDPCTVKQAWRLAAGANALHGLPMSNADKRRTVSLLLASEPEESDRLLAQIVGVSHTLVSEIRKEKTLAAAADKAQIKLPPPPEHLTDPTSKLRWTVLSFLKKCDEQDSPESFSSIAEIETATGISALKASLRSMEKVNLVKEGEKKHYWSITYTGLVWLEDNEAPTPTQTEPDDQDTDDDQADDQYDDQADDQDEPETTPENSITHLPSPQGKKSPQADPAVEAQKARAHVNTQRHNWLCDRAAQLLAKRDTISTLTCVAVYVLLGLAASDDSLKNLDDRMAVDAAFCAAALASLKEAIDGKHWFERTALHRLMPLLEQENLIEWKSLLAQSETRFPMPEEK